MIRAVVASGLVGSALIHGMVAGEHFVEWAPAGAFFLGAQAVELGLALIAVYAWCRWVAASVLVTGVATLTVWAVSRTAGMPIGPADFRVPESVGAADLACAVLESASIVAAAVALLSFTRATPGTSRQSGRRRLVLALTSVLAASVITLWGGAPTVFATDGHHHGDPAGSSAR